MAISFHHTIRSITKMRLLSSLDVLSRGLKFLDIDTYNKSNEWQLKTFHAHYGSKPNVLADMWFDLVADGNLTKKEKSIEGFKRFMMAFYFLYHYPKSSEAFAARFKVGERSCRGKPLWDWISLIASLKKKKIKWPARLNSSLTETFIVTVDGVDFRVWEKQHPLFPIDKSQCSQKFSHGAVKYEIAISIFEPKVVSIDGPHRGGKHDLTIFKEKLMHLIREGKKVIADRGYRSNQLQMLSTPNALDSKQLHNFKSRARARHETFNGRIKKFQSMEQTFRHGAVKHKLAFEAVVVTLQYQMDNGNPIFDV